MATAGAARGVGPKEFTFLWEGRDKGGKVIRGELRSDSEAAVNATLRRQGIIVKKVRKQKFGSGGKVKEKDISLFTRQLATMMKDAARADRPGALRDGSAQTSATTSTASSSSPRAAC